MEIETGLGRARSAKAARLGVDLIREGSSEKPPIRRRIRFRRWLGPGARFEDLFRQTEARHDLVEATFTARLHGSSAALEGALSSMAGRDAVFRLSRRTGAYAQLDTRPDTSLFAGQGEIRTPAGQGVMVLTLRMQLNPSRFVAHQSTRSPNAIRARGTAALRFNPEAETRLSALTLDGNDNVLVPTLDTPGLDAHCPWWNAILAAYMDAMRAEIVEWLAPAAAGLTVDRAEFGPLHRAEVQFEFIHRDARAWVGAFAKALSVADDASMRRYGWARQGARNAEIISLGLTKDIRLKLYAKQNQVVRFEIVFEKAGRITQITSRNKISTESSIADRLGILKFEAVKQLRKAWDRVMQVTEAARGVADIFDFMARLHREVPAEDVREMVSALGTQRRVTATAVGGFAPEPVCRGLVRAGVLIRVGIVTRGPPRYALAPPFSGMFDRLLGQSDAATTLH